MDAEEIKSKKEPESGKSKKKWSRRPSLTSVRSSFKTRRAKNREKSLSIAEDDDDEDASQATDRDNVRGLPVEVWIEVVAYLDLMGRKTLRLVSRAFDALVFQGVLRQVGLTLHLPLQRYFSLESIKRMTGVTQDLRLSIAKEDYNKQYQPFSWDKILASRSKGEIEDPADERKEVYSAFFGGLQNLNVQIAFRPGSWRYPLGTLTPTFVHAASNLRSLTIGISSIYKPPPFFGCLQDSHWPSLEELLLRKLQLSTAQLATFFRAHTATLKRLALMELSTELQPSLPWLDIFRTLSETLNLHSLFVSDQLVEHENSIATKMTRHMGDSVQPVLVGKKLWYWTSKKLADAEELDVGGDAAWKSRFLGDSEEREDSVR